MICLLERVNVRTCMSHALCSSLAEFSTSKVTRRCEESDPAAKALKLYESAVMGCDVPTVNRDEQETIQLGKVRSCS